MDVLTDNPGLAALVGGIIFAVLLMVVLFGFIGVQRRKNLIDTILWDRENGFDFKKSEEVAGLASYGMGGFDLRPDSVISMTHSGTILEIGESEDRRASKPVYIVRQGDTAPITFNVDGSAVVKQMSAEEYREREDLTAEIGNNEGVKSLLGFDWILGGLVIVIVIVAIPLSVMAARLALN